MAITPDGAETDSALGVERHSMRRIREVLRLKYECGLSHRSVSASTGMSKGSVSDYLRRADEACLTWEQARELDEAALERLLFRAVGCNEPPERVPIDLTWARQEMRKTGVTLQLVWAEYREAVLAAGDPARRPYQYSQFCELYRRHEGKVECDAAVLVRRHLRGRGRHGGHGVSVEPAARSCRSDAPTGTRGAGSACNDATAARPHGGNPF